MPDGFDHPDLARVDASVRAEWRAEEEAATSDAMERWRRARTLVDWLVERMHVGDSIAATIGPQSFTGTVDEVGRDTFGLRTPFARVDVHLGAVGPLDLALVEHATAGGHRASLQRSFRDILIAREHEATVTIGTASTPDGIDGRVACAGDFVTIMAGDGAELVVPMDRVLWVALRPSASR
jgi:hypothetical protein